MTNKYMTSIISRFLSYMTAPTFATVLEDVLFRAAQKSRLRLPSLSDPVLCTPVGQTPIESYSHRCNLHLHSHPTSATEISL